MEPERSSASEIVADFAFETGLKLNAEAARLLYAGIIEILDVSCIQPLRRIP